MKKQKSWPLLYIHAQMIMARRGVCATAFDKMQLTYAQCLEIIDDDAGQTEIICKVKAGKKKRVIKTKEWKALRKEIISKHGKKCMKCGILTSNANVDHIKPKSKYPELVYNADNLQVLCWSCNKAKSDKIEIDYRKPQVSLVF